MTDREMAVPVAPAEKVMGKQVKQEAFSNDSSKHKWPYQYQKSSKLILNEDDAACDREEPSEEVTPSEIAELENAAAPKAAQQEDPEEAPKGVQARQQSPQVKWSDHWPRPLGKKRK